jgi:MYXO-CTERM domain-containing protein
MITLLSVAHAQSLVVQCGGDATLLLVGVPPYDLRCTASDPDGTLRDDAVWRFGDGAGAEGAVVDHRYDEVGHFVLSAEAPAEDGALEEVRGQVTVCGAPRPRFELHFRGGLDYVVENTTPPDPGCLDELRWDVFRGRGQGGEVVFGSLTWEPEFTFPDEDTYTVVLSIGGIGGVAASALEVEADGGFTDAYDDAAGNACSTTGPVGGWAVGLVAALAAARRRR